MALFNVNSENIVLTGRGGTFGLLKLTRKIHPVGEYKVVLSCELKGRQWPIQGGVWVVGVAVHVTSVDVILHGKVLKHRSSFEMMEFEFKGTSKENGWNG